MDNEPTSLITRNGVPIQSSGTHSLEPSSSGVVPSRLCDRCSSALRRFEAVWRRISPSKWETCFHSQSRKQLLESIAAGCHLCTQVGKATNLKNGDNSSRIVFQCWSKHPYRPTPVVEFAAWDDSPNPNGPKTTRLASFDIEEIDVSKHLLPERLLDGSRFVAPSSTDSPEAFGLIRHWLNDCLKNHPGCRRGNFETLPTRLIDVGQSEQLTPRICIPANSPAMVKTPYLTLSHSWGLTGDSLRLTTKNIDEWQAGGIPLDGLAQTFCDAMRITQQLGYRYIWIDSLCIMQDSEEDWEREAHTMTAVYGNSLLTIFASGMANADPCFSTRNPLEVYPCTISPSPDAPLRQNDDSASILPSFYAISWEQKEKIRMLSKDWAQNPLLCRGWVLQERLLSCRIVYYGAAELYWECLHHMVFESYPLGRALKSTGFLDFYDHYTVKSAYQGLQNESLKMDEIRISRVAGHWATLVQYYTATNLTYASDRLVALAGVVRAIEESRGFTYILGSWREFFPLDLLWSADCGERLERFEAMQMAARKGLQTPSDGSSANMGLAQKELPSWSWAATEMPKSYWFWGGYDFKYMDEDLGNDHYVWKCPVDVLDCNQVGFPSSIHDGTKHHGDEGRSRHMATLSLKTYLKPVYGEAEFRTTVKPAMERHFSIGQRDFWACYDRIDYGELKSEQYLLLLVEFMSNVGIVMQQGLIVMQTESDDPNDTGEVRKRLYSRLGMWAEYDYAERTWWDKRELIKPQPPMFDRSKERETTIYLR